MVTMRNSNRLPVLALLIAVLSLGMHTGTCKELHRFSIRSLQLDGVSLGDSVAHVRKVLGKPSIEDSTYLAYNGPPLNRIVLFEGDRVKLIQWCSAVSRKGVVLLKAGDNENEVVKLLGSPDKIETATPQNSMYVYTEGNDDLEIAIASHKIACFSCGNHGGFPR